MLQFGDFFRVMCFGVLGLLGAYSLFWVLLVVSLGMVCFELHTCCCNACILVGCDWFSVMGCFYFSLNVLGFCCYCGLVCLGLLRCVCLHVGYALIYVLIWV